MGRRAACLFFTSGILPATGTIVIFHLTAAVAALMCVMAILIMKRILLSSAELPVPVKNITHDVISTKPE